MTRFDAFGSRNFRRYFVGQVISSVGTWLQTLALSWLVLELTDDSAQLGVVVALQYLPLLVLGAPAGLLADRVDNRRLLMITSTLSGLAATAFGVAVSTDAATPLRIDALALVLGLVLAVERPAMQAILYQLVGPETLPSAVAVNSTIMSAARLVGPALGGVLIQSAGIAACFYANAASYLVVLGALVAIRPSQLVDRPLTSRARGRIREGFAYVRATPEVARPLLVMAVMGVVAYNFGTTIPSMVKFGFDHDAGGVAAAMSVSAIGSLLGGIYIAGITPHSRRTHALTLLGFGVTVAGFGLAPTFGWFVALSVPVGFASATFQSVNTVVVQQAAEPSMHGRVMALHQMAWFGSTPIGALAMGWLIRATSPRVPFALAAISALVCAAAVSTYAPPMPSTAPET